MRYSNGFLLCLLVPVLTVLASCATSDGGTREASTTPPRAQSSASQEDAAAGADAERLRSLLSEASGSPGSWSHLHLSVECQNESGLRSLELFNNGVAIWNKKRQFQVSLSDIAHMMTMLEEADFPAFVPVYGGKTKSPDAGKPAKDDTGENATMVTCRIQLDLDGVRKESVQLFKGKQFPGIKNLAENLLDYCREDGETGVATTDLQDGLEKLARGELAPEVLTVMLHRKPDKSSPTHDGFLLRLTGPQATTRPFDPQQGYGETLALELDVADVESLARSLADVTPDSFPANLWADDYTDLSIQVLDRRKSIQARQFARLTPSTHGQRQVDFDSVYSTLQEIHRRALDEGRPDNGM